MTLGNSPKRGEPLPKKAEERGRDAGRGNSPSYSKERLEKEPGERGGQGGPGVQDPEPRAEKFGTSLHEWPRSWGKLGRRLRAPQPAREGEWGRERGQPASPPVVTPSAGIGAQEHLLVLSPKAWSGALSCDWPTGRPSRVAETRADWATAATFSSHPRRCQGLRRPGEKLSRGAPSPGEKGRLTLTAGDSPKGVAAAEWRGAPISVSVPLCVGVSLLDFLSVSLCVSLHVFLSL